ncbi:hypothetical protein [Mycobacterium sp. 852002-51057_SCH5723018]|uniref:hypothetical protein n=1 Tax=Mycobacterium sp. 852002-51057_SCH5723018 TaxID=1834094 RepID=UPI0008010082|nr:hypothetical protein [Mycobacterium sp. 852002-51057_SCH5723018]OBG22399.1 hypothetical protein A5764_13345 [Mycobacterium sp. 852002-51057_SCH5723018]
MAVVDVHFSGPAIQLPVREFSELGVDRRRIRYTTVEVHPANTKTPPTIRPGMLSVARRF